MSFSKNSVQDETIFERIHEDLDSFEELGIIFRKSSEHTNLWNKRYEQSRQKFIDEDHKVSHEKITNFWSSRIFIGDNPTTDQNKRTLRNMILGDFRGERQLLKTYLEILERNGFDQLLRKYPCPPVGNPGVFHYKGYTYTSRWTKHIYLLGLMNRVLASRLDHGFVALDIGSHCGFFSNLVHQEYPGSTQVLVDLPETLLLALYFLSSCFPDARIASIKELLKEKEITRDFLKSYDFVLLPSQLYDRLEPGSVDLVTSFACLGELTRTYFEYYIHAPVFKKATFFFTANPIDSTKWFKDSDLTILDYPIWEQGKKLEFGISPIFFHPYSRPERRSLFFYRFKPFHQFFEYIGEM